MENREFCRYIANISIKSMLYEVSATPKPGLVDRSNSGAHKDMDFFTFINSTSVLYSYFYSCTEIGINFKDEDYRDLLRDIRPIGMDAESDMFKATNGINTHKGMIFSLGIIVAALGSLFKEYREVKYSSGLLKNRVMEIAKGICRELKTDNKEPTYGETLFKEHGIMGIRGEVESGFPTVVEISLPIFTDLIEKETYHINTILVHVLIHLMKYTEDSNILGRHDMDRLEYTKAQASKAIELGGYLETKGREYIRDMDRDFIEKYISPGGAADLLAITVMFFLIENGDVL